MCKRLSGGFGRSTLDWCQLLVSLSFLDTDIVDNDAGSTDDARGYGGDNQRGGLPSIILDTYRQ